MGMGPYEHVVHMCTSIRLNDLCLLVGLPEQVLTAVRARFILGHKHTDKNTFLRL